MTNTQAASELPPPADSIAANCSLERTFEIILPEDPDLVS
jgi:hypothetical protein